MKMMTSNISSKYQNKGKILVMTSKSFAKNYCKYISNIYHNFFEYVK